MAIATSTALVIAAVSAAASAGVSAYNAKTSGDAADAQMGAARDANKITAAQYARYMSTFAPVEDLLAQSLTTGSPKADFTLDGKGYTSLASIDYSQPGWKQATAELSARSASIPGARVERIGGKTHLLQPTSGEGLQLKSYTQLPGFAAALGQVQDAYNPANLRRTVAGSMPWGGGLGANAERNLGLEKGKALAGVHTTAADTSFNRAMSVSNLGRNIGSAATTGSMFAGQNSAKLASMYGQEAAGSWQGFAQGLSSLAQMYGMTGGSVPTTTPSPTLGLPAAPVAAWNEPSRYNLRGFGSNYDFGYGN